MKAMSYLRCTGMALLLLTLQPALAQQAGDADGDDTADIDTQSSVDTASAGRLFSWSGDLRPLLNTIDIDTRDGGSLNDTTAQARLRLRMTRGIVDGVQFGARLAGRCSSEDCDLEWISSRETPQSNGLGNGQFTFDEMFLHFFRRERFNLTVGRQQTRFVLRGGVFSRSLDRNDSSNTNVTWTDGLHFTLRRREGWETHAIIQHNAASGSGSVRRAPLDFAANSARTSYFVGVENTNAWGPVVQRSLGVTYLPNSLLVDGAGSSRRESYAGYVLRMAATWPLGVGTTRLRAGFELGHAPEVPSSQGAGITARVDGIAWNVAASLMDVRPRHNVGVSYSRTGAGWLLSPNYAPNEEAAEIRYQWRPRNWPAVDARLRWREDIARQSTALQKRSGVDVFVRLTWQFGG